MTKNKKPLLKKRGHVKIGTSFFICMHATWPSGKIELYNDHIFLSTGINSITLKYNEITEVETILEKSLRFKHKKQKTPYVTFYASFSKTTNIIKLLKEKKVVIKKKKNKV